MKALKCPTCGAKVKIGSNTCEYCGTTYEYEKLKEASSNKNSAPRHSVSEIKQLISDIRSVVQKKTLATKVPTVIFMLIWCVMSLTPVFFVRGFGVVFLIVPLLFAAFGIVILISVLAVSGGGNFISIILNELEAGRIENAFTLSKTYSSRSKHVLAISVILAYYLMDNEIYAKTNITRIDGLTYYSFNNVSSILAELYTYFGVTPPRVEVPSSINH